MVSLNLKITEKTYLVSGQMLCDRLVEARMTDYKHPKIQIKPTIFIHSDFITYVPHDTLYNKPHKKKKLYFTTLFWRSIYL